MGAIQSAVNRTLGLGAAIKGYFSSQVRTSAIKSSDDIKREKLKQRADVAKYKEKIAKSKLNTEKYKLGLKELKNSKSVKNEGIYLGGQRITDPKIIKMLGGGQ